MRIFFQLHITRVGIKLKIIYIEILFQFELEKTLCFSYMSLLETGIIFTFHLI